MRHVCLLSCKETNATTKRIAVTHVGRCDVNGNSGRILHRRESGSVDHSHTQSIAMTVEQMSIAHAVFHGSVGVHRIIAQQRQLGAWEAVEVEFSKLSIDPGARPRNSGHKHKIKYKNGPVFFY